MKRAVVLLLFIFLGVVAHPPPAQADWRWAKPNFKSKPIATWCESPQCIKAAHKRAKILRKLKVDKYNAKKLREWKYWTGLYIPSCTWYRESGPGPPYMRSRYTLRNGGTHGPPIEGRAHGKFQFMPSTYRTRCKYCNWSPLDQELAARLEYKANGTGPWEAC